MNKKQKIIVSVVGITIVLLALLGLTYAYFLTRIQGNTNNKSISVTTAKLELIYGDGNGLIESSNIMPGTTLTDKEFTVTNNGNATVDNYAVYLEELVNELTRPDDMVYTLTCTSSKENKACKGVNETTFPKLAGIIVTNSIDVGETQTYKLTVTYKEMNVDQSDDMNKKVSARVQIYNLADIVDVTGTVTNASAGDYVEMHSNPKTSMITTDNKYLIAAVEPGTHTIYIKDKDGTIKGSKEITIKKGSTASVDGTNITVTNDSQTINADITKIDTTLTINIGETKDYSPFEEGTLAYNILNNAKINANGTEFLKTPKTKVAEEISYTKSTGKFSEQELDMSTQTEWTYGDTYDDAQPWNGGLGTGRTSECNETIVGKYISYPFQTHSWHVKSCKSSTIAIIAVEIFDYEKDISVTIDDHGNSYYYRGNVVDNYVNFAGMCWIVVRIQGDGSIKLILEDQDELCSETMNGNWNIPTTTGGTTKEGNFGYTLHDINTLTASDGTTNSNTIYAINYLNGETNNDKSMAYAFKNFQTGPLTNYLSYLKAGDWCLNDKAYATETENTIALTNQEVLDKQIKEQNFYYDSYVRLEGKVIKEPTLKCNGTNMSKFADDTDMYVGTLTADEIAYAGGIVKKDNLNFYLLNNYQRSNWLYFWTLSPYFSFSRIDIHMFLNCMGNINPVYHDSETYTLSRGSFRPAIQLKSNIQFSGGNGTISNPYVVN